MPITAASRILGVAPYLLVEDIERSAEWYRGKLGFDFVRLFGEPPSFAMVKRDGVIIMLKSVPGKRGYVRRNHEVDGDACWDAYLWVTGVDALYEEFKAKGVTIKREREIMPYNNKDFDIEDCNGYVLCFGEDWEGRT
jgi:catechol 2,3-dioxygenase-like lactoylglutathione lyase family enzyme